MSVELIKYAFVAGEISPRLIGRSDLEKFDLGMALARNWFVDYRGGLSTRPGTEFVDFIKDDDRPVKLFAFQFSPDISNTYVLLFGHEYVRFIQDGAYVLEDGQVIESISKADPGVVTITGHGYTSGDWIKVTNAGEMVELDGRTLEITVLDADTFSLQDPFGNDLDTTGYTTYASGGEVARIYTVTSPYAAEDLETLRADQSRDLLRLTHLEYPVHNLVRNDATDWDLEEEEIGNDVTIPDQPNADPSGSGNASTIYAVTAFVDGEESQLSPRELLVSSVNFTTTAGRVVLTWDPVAGAERYHVYRSIVLDASDNLTFGQEMGFLGRTLGPSFVDNNIIPDFAASPPQHYNPFADGAIRHIEVTAPGSGYERTDTIAVTDANGSGFRGYPVVHDGELLAIIIENGGEGYTNPSIDITSSAGSGATVTFDVGPTEGNYPAVSGVFQQRQIYAATKNQPLTLWGSRPGKFSNFDISQIVTAGDSYEFDIDSPQLAAIRHLFPSRGGLLVMSQTAIWLLRSTDDGAVTSTDALADPHSWTGVSFVPPIRAESDLVYIEGKGSTVRMLSYNEFSRVYSGVDVSILSNHLFGPKRRVSRWTFAEDPHKIIWSVREDGTLLAFTLVKEQEVFAWTAHTTRGLFKDVLAVQEDLTDTTYVVVERFVQGRWTKFIERFAERDIDHPEEAWAVDCGLALGATRPDATLSVADATGTGVEFTASAAVFDSGDVGKVIRSGGGLAEVTAFTSSTVVECRIVREITAVLPETTRPIPQTSGNWTLDEPVMSVGGLWHIEGETVQIQADGSVHAEQVVTNGRISLEAEATRVIAGLGYRCIAKTLPLTAAPQAVIEGRRKRVVGVAARLTDTRGLKVGPRLDKLREMKERTTESYGDPTNFVDGIPYLALDVEFNEDGQVFLVQDYPMPATVLGMVADVDVGDDPE